MVQVGGSVWFFIVELYFFKLSKLLLQFMSYFKNAKPSIQTPGKARTVRVSVLILVFQGALIGLVHEGTLERKDVEGMHADLDSCVLPDPTQPP